MAEYSRIAKGNFTSTGAAQVVNLPFQPDFVKFVNYSSFATPANHGIPRAYWDVSMGQGFAVADLFNATPVLTTGVVIANGISSFAAGQLLQFGAVQNVSTITKAAAAVVTSSSAHGLASGDVVIFSNVIQTATTGMPQICGFPLTVTVTGATTFTIPWNTNQSNYTAYNAGSSQATFKKVLYPYLYAPNAAVISAITTGTTTTINTACAHNLHVGSEVALHVPSQWGTIELNSLPNTSTPGSPVYGYVVAVTDYQTVVVNINSTGYTAFNSNQTFANIPGLDYAFICPVGDVNSGGAVISSTSPLYPSSFNRAIGTTQIPTINGPAISGAFINNTAQGFVIGVGATVSDASAVLVGANGNVIYWEAFLHDYS